MSTGLGDDYGALVGADNVIVGDAAFVGEERLPRLEGDGEVSPFRVGELYAVAGLERS